MKNKTRRALREYTQSQDYRKAGRPQHKGQAVSVFKRAYRALKKFYKSTQRPKRASLVKAMKQIAGA